MAVYSKIYPSLVKQKVASWHCWAAALESWGKCVYNEDIPRDVIIRQFKAAGHADQNGGLNMKRIHVLIDLFHLDAEPTYSRKLGPSWQLSSKWNEANLGPHLFEPLMLFHGVGGSSWHTIVVYGVDGDTLFFMDPSTGKNEVHKSSYLDKVSLILFRRSLIYKSSNWNYMLHPVRI